MIVQPPQTQNRRIMKQNVKGWYFRFDDDNNIGYKCILSII